MRRAGDRRWFGWGGRVERPSEPSELPADFSASHYLELNPDLADLAGEPGQIEDHYLRYGRVEGRIYKVDATVLDRVPLDFDGSRYIEINSDLKALRGRPLAVKGHYVVSGRKEGRSYKTAEPEPRELKSSIMLRDPPLDWRALFEAHDFRDLNPDLAGEAQTPEAALKAFEARGIDRLAALSRDVAFDPVFYAERFPSAAVLTPAGRYRHWLEIGLPAGWPGTERAAVRNLLDLSEFPQNFDWQRYVAGRTLGGNRRWTRLLALEHLVRVGLARGEEVPLAGEGSGPFLVALSDVLWAGRQFDLAFKMLQMAIDVHPADDRGRRKLAARRSERLPATDDRGRKTPTRAHGLWRRLWSPAHEGGRFRRLERDRHGTPQDGLPQDFSVEQYIALNPDLALLGADPERAERHYVHHGKAEGRSYRLDENLCGQLPADFEPDSYLDLNPDLESLRGRDSAVEAHYLANGRPEGRSYKIARSVEPGLEPSILARDPGKDWRDLFKPGDFRALRPDLAHGASTAEALLAAFEARGIDAVAPLSLDHRFDPAFYADRFPETATLPVPRRHREWLERGIPAGRPGCEEEAVRNLLGLSAFPDSFDWRGYADRLGPAAHGWSRIRLLEHLVAVGSPRGEEIPLAGDAPGPFLLAVSDVLWASGRRPVALKVLRRALDLAPDDGELHGRMAHRCIEAGRNRDAELHERRALALGKSSVWVYANLAELASERGDPAESYRLLERSRSRYEGLAPWRRALSNAVEADFAATAARAMELYRAGERAAGDVEMTGGLARIADRLRSLEDLPGFVGPTAGGHVVLFANHALPQCRHYRIEQRSRQLDLSGIPHRIFTSEEAEGAREALVGARALVVYREPAFPATIRLLLHARAMGVPTFYDIDDLIFDPAHYPEDFSTFERQISFEAYLGLLYGTPLVRFAITLCDVGLTSTTALSRHVAPLTLSGRCHVVPNGLDDRNARFLEAPVLRADDGEVVILYGSGSQAHNRNFNETVGPALLELLAAHPHVVLAVAGYLDLDPAFGAYAHRIRSFPFSRDLAAYWALLSEVDINLAVLTPGAMNDAKSEIKWLEAAVSGVPSVVSASARYREVVRDGVDGLLADSPEAWRDALFRLVEDGTLRRRIGERARERARVDYALDAVAARLAAALEPAPAAAPARPRLRLLVVHVLFPPQSSGGATRVVRDNVDDLLDRYGDEIELAVYTTDFDAPVPAGADGAVPVRRSSRMGHYRTVPVFRVSRGNDTEFTYRDEEAGHAFAAVLASWKPQVVHFHCVQFLTGSVVEACRAAGVPYLVTLHDAWWISPSQFLIDDDNLPQAPGLRALADGALTMAEVDRRRFLGDQLAGAAALLAVSDSFAEIYRRAGFPATRSVPNGLSSLFLTAPERASGRPGGRVRLGHVGGLSRHKGSHLFRLALENGRFGHLEAVLVDHAMTPDERREEMWGTTPATVRGPADQDRVLALYAELDVLVAPSIWPESYGLVSREALATGLWVVASDLGALGEDIVEGENGFRIDVRDAADLARVLGLIDADPERFRAPPARRGTPRLASTQADDLVAIYREFALPPSVPGSDPQPWRIASTSTSS